MRIFVWRRLGSAWSLAKLAKEHTFENRVNNPIIYRGKRLISARTCAANVIFVTSRLNTRASSHTHPVLRRSLSFTYFLWSWYHCHNIALPSPLHDSLTIIMLLITAWLYPRILRERTFAIKWTRLWCPNKHYCLCCHNLNMFISAPVVPCSFNYNISWLNINN